MNNKIYLLLLITIASLYGCKKNNPIETKRDNSPTVPSIKMVSVNGGTFTKDTTSITISGFKIDIYEVTFEIWNEIRTWALSHGYTDLPIGDNGYNPSGHGEKNNPVANLNWYDVVKWCNARSEQEGLTCIYYTDSTQTVVYRTGQINLNLDAVKWHENGYRLPSEAEWEFAARGGNSSHGYIYSGSNDANSVGWFIGPTSDGTHTVGTKSPNELGIYDMTGNVSEWCWDWYGSIYPSGGTIDPKGPILYSGDRVLRGNTRYLNSVGLIIDRVVDRESYPSNFGISGFRCVKK